MQVDQTWTNDVVQQCYPIGGLTDRKLGDAFSTGLKLAGKVFSG